MKYLLIIVALLFSLRALSQNEWVSAGESVSGNTWYIKNTCYRTAYDNLISVWVKSKEKSFDSNGKLYHNVTNYMRIDFDLTNDEYALLQVTTYCNGKVIDRYYGPREPYYQYVNPNSVMEEVLQKAKELFEVHR